LIIKVELSSKFSESIYDSNEPKQVGINRVPLIEILVPTFNRPKLFYHCLGSIEKALICLKLSERSKIGIAVNNNSTVSLAEYKQIVSQYAPLFTSLGILYFNYRVTGFNIGGINNAVGGIFSTEAEYVWCLPDDDIARFDSLRTLISTIEKYRPSFISGAWMKKSIISYDSDETGADDGEGNKILDTIMDRSRLAKFLSMNVVQLQEYVYRAEPVKNFLHRDENLKLLTDMWPGLFAIACLQEKRPFVRLERSIGIFRDGDPASSWRHLWYRFALIDWPKLSVALHERGLLTDSECEASVKVFSSLVRTLWIRPDILLGVNRRFELSPLTLWKFHRNDFVAALWSIVPNIADGLIRRIKKSARRR
jgi:hypothetical protein